VDIEMVKVVTFKPRGGYLVDVTFSNGASGTVDMHRYCYPNGPMTEPLADQAYFNRVTVVDGIPTWPNEYDIDAIALHMRMKAAGLLQAATQAAE
jgi:hypothetical protein